MALSSKKSGHIIITVWILLEGISEEFLVSFIYASNFVADRKHLWQDLIDHYNLPMFKTNPWLLCGEFNGIINLGDHSNVPPSFDDAGMMDFRNMVNHCMLQDINTSGPHYTWCNKREEGLVYKKIDRIMCNQAWTSMFGNAYGKYESGGCSDHLRGKIVIDALESHKRIPFKFVNETIKHPHFIETISAFWNQTTPLHISTAATFLFSKKLKALKPTLRQLGRAFIGDIEAKTKAAFERLCHAQDINFQYPSDQHMEIELEAQRVWESNSIIEEAYLRQKAKIHWLQVGDKNNKYFHRIAKQRQLKNAIREIHDTNGNVLTMQADIKAEATRFFEDFLTHTPQDSRTPSVQEINSLIRFSCSNEQKSQLTLAITDEEIKNTLFRMPKNKSPGPDGFTTEFFIATWSIIGSDFTAAIHSFFRFGFLPKGVNSTILALIPKKEAATQMKDFRPISCCNVIYKVISKILATRLKLLLPHVILRNQSVFVAGRLIMENVLLATELVKDYHKETISKRSAIKIDIAKAFDSVQWSFVRNTLTAMGIPNQFTHWVMLCISTASFSVQVNGELAGYFTSKRGLRQGCSLSPYLFVICMNILSHLIDTAALAGQIGYHPRCKNIVLTHICFADDLLVFSDGTTRSLEGILSIFKDFERTSGLKISLEKSTIYLAGLTREAKEEITQRFGFKEGNFPVKYLGLPLTTRKLTMMECRPLLDRLRAKITSWTTRFLSYAGRLQLINSVIVGITNYWLAAFCLPKKCIHEIHNINSAFLWSGPELNGRKVKLKWEDVCSPKIEGGLGLRNLKETMKICYLKLVWRILSRQPSLWVDWVWKTLIKGGCFWLIKDTTSMGSWVWKKILKHRNEAKKFYKIKIGNGKHIAFWFDIWNDLGCLYDLLGSRGTIDMGIPLKATLFEAIHNRQSRRHRSTILNQVEDQIRLTSPQIEAQNAKDIVLWKHTSTKYLDKFSSKLTWLLFREQRFIVVWHKLIWFKHATPKYAFCTWLAFQDRLSTRDRMRSWNGGGDVLCLLCNTTEETRDHIFIECGYSQHVWKSIMGTLLGSHRLTTWTNLAPLLLSFQGSKMLFFLMCYALQSTIYHIWRERNNRNHGQQPLPTRIMSRIIDKNIRNNISAIQKQGDTKFTTAMTTWFSTRQ